MKTMVDGTGGGRSYNGFGGGGATDVRMVKGEWDNTESLLSRIIVAAGGAGNSKYKDDGSHGNGSHAGDLNNGYNGSSVSGNNDYVGKGANKDSAITSVSSNDVFTDSEGVEKIIPTYEKGSLGKGGSVDYDGAGAGGSGYFGGSAAHDEYAGGGSGISYIYTGSGGYAGTIVGKDGIARRYPLTTAIVLEYRKEIEESEELANLVNAFGNWKNITFNSGSQKVMQGNGMMSNPLKYLGFSEAIGHNGNGYVIIKKIS